ncbi:MAG: sucrase ferredoxin [Cyanobacteria bacterium P01_D01_bin.1]
MPTDATAGLVSSAASSALASSALASRADAQPCQYCSITSKASGEDPIGTAVSAQQWLFIEVPQPWAKNPWENESAALLALFEKIEKRPRLWRDLRILAIAPDKVDSTKGDRHVFFYSHPSTAAATYTQQHYHIPTEQLSDLIDALVFHPNQLGRFSSYQQSAARALFVCTHTRYDLACGRFGTPLYRTLRKHYAQPDQLSVWQTTHFGGHHFAPTLIDFPTGQFWGHLEPKILDTLVYRQDDVAKLKPFYRGWSGFSTDLALWAQIAERSLWMQQGWTWLETPRTTRIIRKDPGRLTHRLLRLILRWVPTIWAQVLLKKLAKKLTWAEVEISWPDQKTAGRYRVRVEIQKTVLSQMKSGTDADLIPVPQYRVRQVDQRNRPVK